MSKPHHEPRIVNVQGSPRVPYVKEKPKISILWNRLLYNTRYFGRHWGERIFVKATVGLLIYTVGLYAFVWKCYGSEHPLNRFQWRQMKKNGQLSEEMLRKEEIVTKYMKSRLDRIYDKESPYAIRRQGPPGAIDL